MSPLVACRRSLCAAVVLVAAGLGAAAPASAQSKPFPQHTPLASGVILPTAASRAALDSKVVSFHAAWKARYLKVVAGTSPVQKYVFYNLEGDSEPANAVSVSEGHGYGMLASVVMAGADAEAKADFDALYRFYKAHPSVNAPALMAWQQIRDRSGVIVDNVADGADSATDGDLDIALALLMADRQWGSSGAIDYRGAALASLAAQMARVVNHVDWTLKLGDWAASDTDKYGKGTRSSDFMPAHLKTFARLDTARAADWTRVYNKTIDIVVYQATSGGSGSTGLMPDFFVKASSGRFVPAPPKYLEGKTDGDYSWNACRTPWRLAVDRIMTGDTAMTVPLGKLDDWIRAKTKGKPAAIRAGYAVASATNGKPLVSYGDLAFTAPFAVTAMATGRSQAWLDALWAEIVATPITEGGYYGNSIKLMTMLVVSGNWWQP